jgi:hypothetical protein
VDYREIRVGLNLEYKIAEGVELSCEAGLVTDRKFEFHRVDAVYDTDGAAFASVGVKCSF